MKIAVIPSSQRTSTGSGIGNHNERELMVDLSARLVPKLRAAGHDVQQFLGATEVGSDAAHAAVSWHPNICIDLHLDSAGGASAALLCYQAHVEMGLKILANYCACMGYRNKGGMLRTPGTNGVAVLRIPEAAGIPTALIECGDMDAPDGANWLRAEHREKAATCLCRAICAYAGGSILKPQEDDDMALVTSGGRVSSFAGIFYIGEMGGARWDVWAKVQNPTAQATTARIVAVTNDVAAPSKVVPVGPNQIVQVQIGKEMGCKGNTLVTIEPGIPAVCTFDHRPTQ